MIRIVWLTIWRITNLIWELKGVHFFTLLSELLYYVKLLLLYYHHKYHYYSQVEILSRFLIGILIGSFQDSYNRSLKILTRILLSFLSNLIRFLAGSYQDF